MAEPSNLYIFAGDVAEYSKWLVATAGILMALVGGQGKEATTPWRRWSFAAAMLLLGLSFVFASWIVFHSIGVGLGVTTVEKEATSLDLFIRAIVRPLGYQMLSVCLGAIFLGVFYALGAWSKNQAASRLDEHGPEAQ